MTTIKDTPLHDVTKEEFARLSFIVFKDFSKFMADGLKVIEEDETIEEIKQFKPWDKCP